MTTGETDLAELLWNMQPVLQSSPFVFCSMKPGERFQAAGDAWGMMRETEGITYIIPAEIARRHGIPDQGQWALITLAVHSSLSAVGFLAMVTTSLAMKNISVNAISAYYHDHLFVRWDERHRAMDTLTELSGRRGCTTD